MGYQTQIFSKPLWEEDELDSQLPPRTEAPYFDTALGAWVLSRYADVLAAFQSPALTPAGPNSKKNSDPPDKDTHARMRSETLDALSAAQLSRWREQLASLAQIMVDHMFTGHPVELVDAFARPICLVLAVIATGADTNETEYLLKLAQQVSASAAEPFDAELRRDAAVANTELRKYFHAGPETLRDSGFVALSQTLPCLLANAWFALLQNPQEWSCLHQHPDLLPQAIEELLRYACLPRILFRRAIEDIDFGGISIKTGDRLILRLVAANRDREHFSQPDKLDIRRRGASQIALGAGPHSCVGGGLIRMAAIAMTRPLIERFAIANLIEPVEWLGGSGFRSPKFLQVQFQEDLSNREAPND